MSTREQFGKYLLLKKLSEDPLGETFRAGLLGSSGMERMTLLRIFNGQGIDGQRLWEGVRDRQEVQSLLRNPNIGDGVDLGEIEGIPYVAYDYVSGVNLATLLEQAARKRNFIPAEHALLITERLALALAAAYETRYEEQRVLHGFVVPHLAIISNEGETRLLGFEVGPGLRGFATNPVIRQHFGRYLAPEALTGAGPDRADDIYSMGVILFELLTGRPLPAPAADGYAGVIDQGILATEGEPIPEALRDLLKKSLVPRGERLADVVAWHKTLNAWMFEGQYNPTTFNLAFFMHNLFRQEIEAETQEIEAEKTMPVPVVKPTAAPAAPTPAPAAAAVSDGTGPFIPETVEKPKSKTGLILGLAAVAVAAIGVAIYMTMGGGAQPAEPAPVTQAPPPPPVPEGPSEEEIQAKIQELIDKQAGTLEEQFRTQYEDQLKALESQLADAKRLAEERKQQELERQQELEEQQREAERQRAEEEAAKQAEAAAAAAKEAEEEPVEVAQNEPPPEVTPPPPVVTPPPPPPPPPPPRAPQVRRGDLVEMGPGVTPPATVRLSPRFPEMARRLNKKEATVVVRVLIDENGEALEAEVVGKKVGFGFDAEALQAVRRATWKAATKDGVPVKVWYTLTVKFQE